MKSDRRISLIAVSALLGALLVPVGAAAVANGAELPPSGLQTGFQIDGDKTGGTPTPPGTFDWNSFLTAPAPDGSFTFTPTGPYTTAQGNQSTGILGARFSWDNGTLAAACSGVDATGSPGSQTPNTNPWAPGAANVNDKGNLCSSASAYEVVTDAGGVRHSILYTYFTRLVGNGDMSAIQLLQGPLAGRCDDVLVEFDYSDSTGLMTARFREWTPTAGDDCANPNGAGQWVETGQTIDFDWAVGVRTEGPAGGNQPQATFGEFAVDLTAAGLFSPEECTTFVASTVASRTGNDFTAQTQDYFTPVNPLTLANCGTLTVTKEVEPEGFESDDTFEYTVNRAGGGVVTPDDDATEVADEIAIGETQTITGVLGATDYRLTETTSAPWALQSIVCTATPPGGGTPIVFVLDQPTDPFTVYPSMQTDCLITNATSTVTVEKQTLPDGSTTDFTFAVGDEQAILSDGESATFAFEPGTEVDISETIPAGWLDDPSIECSSDNAVIGGGTATVTTVAGENITCTFTNTQLGTIVIEKQSFGTGGEFDFTGTWAGGEDFSITTTAGDGTPVQAAFANIVPNEYTVTELAEDGWYLADLSCVVGGQPVSFNTEETATAAFTLAPGDTVTCTYVNAMPGRILVTKQTTPAAYDRDFNFTFTPEDAVSQPFILNAASEPAWDSGTLPAGTYEITEAALPGDWELTGINCASDADSTTTADVDSGVTTVDLSDDGLVSCVYTNTAAPATMTLLKSVQGVAADFAWTFDFVLTDLVDGTSQTIAANNADPEITFENLVPGRQYQLTETTKPGWTSRWTCGEGGVLGDAPVVFTAVPGELVACRAVNTAAPASLNLVKSVVGVAEDWEWEFAFTLGSTIRTLSGVGPSTDQATWDDLVPGQMYTLTEQAVPGWVSGAITCVGVPDADTTAAGFQFVAQVEQTLECAATNTAEPVQLQVTKTALGGDATFQFLLTPLSPVGEAIVGNAVTEGGEGVATFDGLVPGTVYSLGERNTPGWIQNLFDCVVTDSAGEVEAIDLAGFIVLPGDFIACEAENRAINAPLELAKSVVGSPIKQSDGTFIVNYAITVYNPGPLPDTYDLDDTLHYGGGISIVSATATSEDGVTIDPGWNGTTSVRVATDVPILADVTHTYGVSARVTVPPAITTDNADCSFAPGESTGLLNEASLSFDQTTLNDDACAPVPASLPPTGVTLSALWVAIGLLGGGAVLLLIRRRRMMQAQMQTED